MTAPTFALLALSLAASSWQANVLSDDPAVRASELAHFRAKGRAGLYALQDLVNRAADPAERARAIRALGELGNPDAEWALYLELKQSTPGVAAAAIRAVTALHLVKLQSAVAAHVGDPDENLTAALGESAELFPKVMEAARKRLVEPRPEAQLAALRTFAAAHAAVPESDARRLLASPRPEISLLAAEALAATDAAAAEAVEAKLAAGPDPLGSRAAFDLAKLGTPEASEALEALARTPACPERAVTALASTAGALPVLISLRANESSLRPLIDRTLSQHPPAVAVLLAVAGGSDDGMAAAAVALLSQRSDGIAALERCVQTLGATAQRCALGLTVPAAAPALQRALESVDERVRTIATEGCATSEETPSLARLAPLANDPSASVRTAAAQAFGRLGAAGLPALQQLVHDRDDGVRAAAADELGKNLPVDALAQLVLGTLEDDVVRPELIASLRRLPGNVALPLLEAEMKHGNATERRLVAAQFARFNDPSVYDVLFQIASRDPDDDTRHIAAKILGN